MYWVISLRGRLIETVVQDNPAEPQKNSASDEPLYFLEMAICADDAISSLAGMVAVSEKSNLNVNFNASCEAEQRHLREKCEKWQPVGESNPSFQVENLAS